ncbi:hypothetical protein [Cellulomonas sp. S1-8]|uniref:hypothetical protein n=1 Tax=Cellulomonas sp. S1-8 TaxID=2904790 RepID=UPI0022431993|nr:hypothetical protein [Cellulomonas sp. S1-8]UZN04215.1 hypothetical protein OKX07_04565 [Cellulomonas sp. S1-8]
MTTVDAGAPAPAAAHPLTGCTTFTMRRRISRKEQFYEIRPVGPDGVEGDVALYASPKQLSLREEYRFSADREHTRRWLTVRARTQMNLLYAVFDAVDERGAAAGFFEYQWVESELFHVWRIAGPGYDVVGRQRNLVVGMARQVYSRLPFATLVPVPFAFDVEFRDATGRVLLRVERRSATRNRFTVTTPGGVVDGRVAAAMTLLLDFRGQA